MTVVELNQENFDQEVLKSELPVIVDFFAPWCGPCKMMAPIFHGLSDEFEGKLKFASLNTQEHGELAAKYGVQSIPNLKLFRNGEVADEMVGMAPKDVLKSKLESML